jgi:hypothetical protein
VNSEAGSKKRAGETLRLSPKGFAVIFHLRMISIFRNLHCLEIIFSDEQIP